MAPQFSIPRVVTGSTWSAVVKSLYDRLRTARPQGSADNGTIAPTMTNREAVALIDDMRRVASPMFPLWYAFAAAAYGWQQQGDELDPGDIQSERYYPADDAAMLWPFLIDLGDKMDAASIPNPRVEVDQGIYDNQIFIAELRASLEHDGHTRDQMEAQFKIPVGCKKEDIKFDKNGLPYCDKMQYADDPVTGIVKGIVRVVSENPIAIAAIILIGMALLPRKE